ncbi:uncharacterized protein N7483_010502 [Penicillium malachiteum]|uniref:uncharacterized protein n=1 Tax=Penicillium malachiteum TaxID=1324776 RepID=UPI00254883B1|nr:uncharacterized protein N7483_010502 [Penicillium malachiteum]KAJ5713321.1 hypothetical protein N7483_010502 [Penicillium malachiteum]
MWEAIERDGKPDMETLGVALPDNGPDNGVFHAIMTGKPLQHWIPVYGRYYALAGWNPKSDTSYVQSWMFNLKSPYRSHKGNADHFWWLGLLMPCKKRMKDTVSYDFTEFSVKYKCT